MESRPSDSLYSQMARVSLIFQNSSDRSAERYDKTHASERVHHNRCEDQRLNRLNSDARYRSILECLRNCGFHTDMVGGVSKPVKISGLGLRRSGREQAPSIISCGLLSKTNNAGQWYSVSMVRTCGGSISALKRRDHPFTV